jgi:hypothetical protein
VSDGEEPGALKERILRFVDERDWVTFAALHRHFAGDARAQTELALPGNRIVWSGLPQSIADAVLELLDEGQMAALPGNKGAYRRDGRVLNLPVERHIPPEGHSEPHWFPVLLRSARAVTAENKAG